jgi:hypothetical protein
MKTGGAVATGTGTTQEAAREAALTATSDDAVRAALIGADPTRPHWVQGAVGEKREAARKAAASERQGSTRAERRPRAKPNTR